MRDASAERLRSRLLQGKMGGERRDLQGPDREGSVFAQKILETQIRGRSRLWKYYRCNIAKVMSKAAQELAC